jgi:hypothetical protein
MHRGFRVNVNPNTFKNYFRYGTRDYDDHKLRVQSSLDALTDRYGRLIAQRITANWFPPIQADVFISYSHTNVDLAIALAGFLAHEFNLVSFIDYNVWGCSDTLLRIIDDEYCYREKTGLYDYRTRNRSTSHVYMMLSVALAQMLNSSECVMFLNTLGAISSEQYIKGYTTESPWIYSELAMTLLIQKRTAREHRRRLAEAMDARADDALRVIYPVTLNHLAPLGRDDFVAWQQTAQGRRAVHPLDVLYELVDP